MMIPVNTMIVSTNVNRGHFGTLDISEGQRAQAALSRGGGEVADRPGNASTRRFSRTRVAGA